MIKYGPALVFQWLAKLGPRLAIRRAGLSPALCFTRALSMSFTLDCPTGWVTSWEMAKLDVDISNVKKQEQTTDILAEQKNTRVTLPS